MDPPQEVLELPPDSSRLPEGQGTQAPLCGPHGLGECSDLDRHCHPLAHRHEPGQAHKAIDMNKEPEPDHDATNPSSTSSESHSLLRRKTQSPEPDQMQEQNSPPDAGSGTEADLELQLKKITQHPTLTPLRKTLYRSLLQIPPGRWTTYSALAKHTRSSARAVGTAMRLNPFAPGVPCHRVLAGDGGLGGYMGTRPLDKGNRKPSTLGGNLGKKREMLEREGVRFDQRGRAIGIVFADFTT